MSIIYAPTAPATLASMITRIRRMVGDTESLAANRRWQDDEIIDALNMSMVEIGNALSLTQPSPALSSENVAYTANSESVALGAYTAHAPIFQVEDITDPLRPVVIEQASFRDLSDYGLAGVPALWRSVYAIHSGGISVRPKPTSDKPLRIWYVQEPYVIGAEDASPSAVSVAANVATATIGSGHGFVAGMRISTDGMLSSAPAEADVSDVAITSVTDTTIIYPCTAANGAFTSVGTLSASRLNRGPAGAMADEVACLGAAIRLQETDVEASPARLMRHEKMLFQLAGSARRLRGPQRIRRTRRFV